MKVKFFYLIVLIFLLIFIMILFNNINNAKYIYNDYSFINNARRNSFNFKYPNNWHVQMMDYWEGNETRESSPMQGVYIYMDSNNFLDYIEIVETHSQAPFSSVAMSYDSSKEYMITKYDKKKAKVYHEDLEDNKTMHIYVTFESDDVPFNNRVGVHVKVNKDYYEKNKNRIWKTIKSIQIND